MDKAQLGAAKKIAYDIGVIIGEAINDVVTSAPHTPSKKASETLLSIKNEIEVWTFTGKLCVSYENCWAKDGIFLFATYGRGDTFEEACEDYLSKIKGRTLVFYEGSSRREITVAW